MSPLEVVKLIRLRTGFFKIYESCDRIEILELHNNKLKRNLRLIREEAFHINEKVEFENDKNKKLKRQINQLIKQD